VNDDRDEIRLPEHTGGLFELAFVSYGRRLPLYLGFAALAFVLQGAIVMCGPQLAPLIERLLGVGPAAATGIQATLADESNAIFDAFVCGLVTIGIVADLRARSAAHSATILSETLARWWVLALVLTVISFLFNRLLAELSDPNDPALLLMAPIVIVFVGALSLAMVVAAVDRRTNELLLPIVSIGRSLQVALPFANLGRLALYSAVFFVPSVLMNLIAVLLDGRHVWLANFWASVPIDALTVGPLQALATIFYLDFVRRLASRPAP